MLAYIVLENIDSILPWLERFAYVDGSSILFDELANNFHARGKVLEGVVGDDHATIEGGGPSELLPFYFTCHEASTSKYPLQYPAVTMWIERAFTYTTESAR